MLSSPAIMPASSPPNRTTLSLAALILGATAIGFSPIFVRLAEVGLHKSQQFARTKMEGIQKRNAGIEAAFARSLEVLRHVYEYAAKNEIRLGIEGRHSFEEIPSEREMEMVLAVFAAVALFATPALAQT